MLTAIRIGQYLVVIHGELKMGIINPVTLTAAALFAADARALNVGQSAPAFRLLAVNGKTYDLADYKGKCPLVLVWYPVLPT